MAELLGYPLSLLLLLAGTALVVAEAFAPGAHFVVLGIALLAAGIVGLLLPAGLGVLAPLVLAGVVIAAGVASFYVYREFDFYGGKGTAQTSDSDSLRGRTGRVTERVTPASGQVKLEEGGFNPVYQARSVSGEIEAGEEVMVVDPGGGNVITVESVTSEDDIDRELARERRRRDASQSTEEADQTDGDVADEDDATDEDDAAGNSADADAGGDEADADAADAEADGETEYEPDRV